MPRPVHSKRTTCRACGGRELALCLPLGDVALANSFLRTEREFELEQRFPLDVYFCKTCTLVQLVDVIDPEVLFRNYLYLTGISDTIATHNVGYAQAVVSELALGPEDLVVEIASNDGSLLKRFQRHGVRTLGIEPARNIAERARADGIETIDRFFDAQCAGDVRERFGPAGAVIGNNVLAHVDEPVDFMRGMKRLLGPRGLAVVEVPELAEFVERGEYDTVYHEHLSYFSVTSLMRVCEEAGLRIVRVDRVPVHGGSIRVWSAPAERVGEHAPAVLEFAGFERASRVTELERLREFARGVETQRAELLELLRRLKREGKSVAGYGAPAKGNTMLNYCGITTELLPYTVDKSSLKVGLFAPGSHIPVLPAQTLLERQPDFCLILAWNFADEIRRQQAEFERRGGRFIVPIPRPRIL